MIRFFLLVTLVTFFSVWLNVVSPVCLSIILISGAGAILTIVAGGVVNYMFENTSFGHETHNSAR
jgi:hypothetical protein